MNAALMIRILASVYMNAGISKITPIAISSRVMNCRYSVGSQLDGEVVAAEVQQEVAAPAAAPGTSRRRRRARTAPGSSAPAPGSACGARARTRGSRTRRSGRSAAARSPGWPMSSDRLNAVKNASVGPVCRNLSGLRRDRRPRAGFASQCRSCSHFQNATAITITSTLTDTTSRERSSSRCSVRVSWSSGSTRRGRAIEES